MRLLPIIAGLSSKPMFELNSELQERVGKMRGDDTDSFKRVANYPVEWLSAKDRRSVTGSPLFMVSDETDGWSEEVRQDAQGPDRRASEAAREPA